jgi:hypothetical protein
MHRHVHHLLIFSGSKGFTRDGRVASLSRPSGGASGAP